MVRARDEVLELETLDPLPADETPHAGKPRATWLAIAVAVFIGVVLGSAGTYFFVGNNSRAAVAAARPGPFDAMAGPWWRDSTQLTISKSGVATLQWGHATLVTHAPATSGVPSADPPRIWFDPSRDLVYVTPFPGVKYPFCREHAFDACGA